MLSVRSISISSLWHRSSAKINALNRLSYKFFTNIFINEKTFVEELCATHNCLFNLIDLKKYIYMTSEWDLNMYDSNHEIRLGVTLQEDKCSIELHPCAWTFLLLSMCLNIFMQFIHGKTPSTWGFMDVWLLFYSFSSFFLLFKR